MRHEFLLKLVSDHPLAVLPSKLEQFEAFLQYRMAGAPAPQYQAARAGGYTMAGSTAVIPVFGAISQRMGMMEEMSGGVSTEQLGNKFREALADPSVRSIVLHIDSPGGSVYGVQELAAEIYSAREQKKIVAVADSLAASAAYWIGSAATELVVTPGGEVGSIGVVAMHVDYSEHLKSEGIKVTYIHAGENKVEGNQAEPLSDDARAFMQSRVNEYYSAFTRAVSKHRGIAHATVLKEFGGGRVFGAAQAKSVGMVDRIATIGEVVRGLQPKSASRRAAAEAHLAIAESVLKTI